MCENGGLGLLFNPILWCLFCFLLFFVTVGKDGNRLKRETIELTFSGFDTVSKKYQKLIMVCFVLKH